MAIVLTLAIVFTMNMASLASYIAFIISMIHAIALAFTDGRACGVSLYQN